MEGKVVSAQEWVDIATSSDIARKFGIDALLALDDQWQKDGHRKGGADEMKAGDVFRSRYRINSLIANKGAFSNVYKATDNQQSNKLVAIKLLDSRQPFGSAKVYCCCQ